MGFKDKQSVLAAKEKGKEKMQAPQSEAKTINKKKTEVALNLGPKFDAFVVDKQEPPLQCSPLTHCRLLVLGTARWNFMKCHPLHLSMTVPTNSQNFYKWDMPCYMFSITFIKGHCLLLYVMNFVRNFDSSTMEHLMIVGDFNFIRSPEDKNKSGTVEIQIV